MSGEKVRFPDGLRNGDIYRGGHGTNIWLSEFDREDDKLLKEDHEQVRVIVRIRTKDCIVVRSTGFGESYVEVLANIFELGAKP